MRPILMSFVIAVACAFSTKGQAAEDCRIILSDSYSRLLTEIDAELKHRIATFVSQDSNLVLVISEDDKQLMYVDIFKPTGSGLKLQTHRRFNVQAAGGVNYQNGMGRIGEAFSQRQILGAKIYGPYVFIATESAIWRVDIGKQGLLGRLGSMAFPAKDTHLVSVLQVPTGLESYSPYSIQKVVAEDHAFKISVSGPAQIEGLTFYFANADFGKNSIEALFSASAFYYHEDMLDSEISADTVFARMSDSLSGQEPARRAQVLNADDQPRILPR